MPPVAGQPLSPAKWRTRALILFVVILSAICGVLVTQPKPVIDSRTTNENDLVLAVQDVASKAYKHAAEADKHADEADKHAAKIEEQVEALRAKLDKHVAEADKHNAKIEEQVEALNAELDKHAAEADKHAAEADNKHATKAEEQVEALRADELVAVNNHATEADEKQVEPLVSELAAAEAARHLAALKSRYVTANRTESWGIRGISWLAEKHNVVLTIAPQRPLHVGKNTFVVSNTRPSVAGSPAACNASLLLLWIRVASAEEIHAGRPLPHSERCEWRFDMQIDSPGTFVVESKLLVWNGAVDVHTKQCAIVATPEGDDRQGGKLLAHHRSFSGIKFYAPEITCCEVCSRDDSCERWYTPSFDGKGNCELVSSEPSSLRGRRLTNWNNGLSRSEPTAVFLGCGMSSMQTLDSPCLHDGADDEIHGSGMSYAVAGAEGGAADTATSLSNLSPALPWCTIDDERAAKASGRWVATSPAKYGCAPRVKSRIYSKYFFMSERNESESPECWFSDTLSNVGQRAMEAGFATFKQNAWESSMNSLTFQGAWKPYACKYHSVATSDEVRACMLKHEIHEISIEGSSIAKFLGPYFGQWLDQASNPKNTWNNWQFANKSETSRSVVVSTLQFPHLLWGKSEEDWRSALKKYAVATPRATKFYLPSNFISSEREAFVHLGRMLRFDEVAQQELGPKGWHRLDFFNPSAAFTFDTATQTDGMHIIGPPMRAAVAKVLHYLCGPK